MIRRSRWLCLTIAVLGAGPATAASSENWPCVQRKVPEISLAAIWTGPPFDPARIDWRTDQEVAGLVERLAPRRTGDEEARAAVTLLARSSGEARQAKLTALLAGLYETINAERADVIAGIERRGESQKKVAESLRAATAKLDALRADPKTDRTKLAQMSDQLAWELRIFDERQRSLRFVCEVPVLIEQRLFGLARAIQSELK
jgi:hypothetical protein